MNHKFFIFLFLINISYGLNAQQILHRNLVIPRANDTIVKQQVNYKTPGRVGENVLWDFGKLQAVDDKYQLIYTNHSLSDSILVGTEHSTRYYYQIRNDSLFSWGFENPTTIINNHIPELILQYPIQYQDKTHGYYQGEGLYCNELHLSAMGTTESMVDAYGIIVLPNQDTLKHVMRVKFTKLICQDISPIKEMPFPEDSTINPISTDSIHYRINNDSTVLVMENYKWFAAGYHRYPVFETVHSGELTENGIETYFSTAFFYPPEEHAYLQNDPDNIAMQNQLALIDNYNNGNGQNNPDNPPANDVDFSYNIYPNPVQSQLTIEYYISDTAQIQYAIYNSAGQQMYLSEAKVLPRGIYTDVIDMGGYASGNYILHIRINEKLIGEKIVKK